MVDQPPDDDRHGIEFDLRPPRTTWVAGFPPVVTHTALQFRDAHSMYGAAKAGDAEMALNLAQDLLAPERVRILRQIVGDGPAILLPISALEVMGFNAIPDAMARVLAEELGLPVNAGEIIQNNRVGHTRAPAFNRFVTPASFEGLVAPGRYILVDDHVGLGGTLANLKGYIEIHGGTVIAMTTLTESRDASQIALRPETLNVLREKHGDDLENLWQESFGHGLDCLTEVEAQILHREPSVVAIRDRLAQATVEARGRGLDPAVNFEN